MIDCKYPQISNTCTLFCLYSAALLTALLLHGSALLWRMSRDTAGDTGGPPNVSFNHQKPNTPSIRTQWGLKEERGCVTGWPWLTGISCVWHVVPKGRDLFLLSFLFSFLGIIRPVKNIWHSEPLNPSHDLMRGNCFAARLASCLWTRPNIWNMSPKVLPQTFSPDISG